MTTLTYPDIHRAISEGDAGSVPPLVAGALTEVAEGRHALRAARHPLGFLCLPMVRAGDYGVCVHLWTDALRHSAPTTSPAHSHSWDLLSLVLYGQVRNDVVAVTDAPDAATHRVFEVHSRGDVDEIRATARLVRTAAGPAELNRAGDAYAMPAGQFHVTVIPDGLDAATVVLGHTRPGAADLSLGALTIGSHHVRRQRCEPAETARAARMVARRLVAGIG